jgi:hypothetical protein
LLENVEQTQKKQCKVYAFKKGLQMFEGFEGEGVKVKMHKLGKKKNLVSSWERPYVLSCTRMGKGFEDQDEGGKTCDIKDLDEKH